MCVGGVCAGATVVQQCPCWTLEELTSLRFPSAGDTESCFKDGNQNEPENSTIAVNWDYWDVQRGSENTKDYQTRVTTIQSYVLFGSDFGALCQFKDQCSVGDCAGLDLYRAEYYLSFEEFTICEQQLNQAAVDRGISCFVN